MITEDDVRAHSESPYFNFFKEVVPTIFQEIVDKKDSFKEKNWGMERIIVNKVVEEFDRLICENGGFEIDGRTVRHAFGIGNNNAWDIVDMNLIKVGSFYCNDDMFGGVYIGVILNGEDVLEAHLK